MNFRNWHPRSKQTVAYSLWRSVVILNYTSGCKNNKYKDSFKILVSIHQPWNYFSDYKSITEYFLYHLSGWHWKKSQFSYDCAYTENTKQTICKWACWLWKNRSWASLLFWSTILLLLTWYFLQCLLPFFGISLENHFITEL